MRRPRGTRGQAPEVAAPRTEDGPRAAPAGKQKGSSERSLQLAHHSAQIAASHERTSSQEALEQDGRKITVRGAGSAHPLAARAARADTRFRLPTFADLKAVYTDKSLKIPEAIIQDRVARLLGRMEHDKRLKTKDPVPTILAKIFPGPGLIDETEFNKAIDVADRDRLYQSVMDADTTVKAADKPGLKTAMTDAIALMKKAEADAPGLKAVFGTKDAVAKTNYGKAQTALGAVQKDLDKRVTTDYNLDDPQVNLGGWAQFGPQIMHLVVDVVKNVDPAETKSTLIHESAHLADPAVDDQGYYASPNFEALPDTTKVANAAHYEELPRRALGTSKFPGLTFTPGTLKSGAAPTWEDTIRRGASEAMREAWDASVDAHAFTRRVRKELIGGSTALFTANKTLLLEMSRVMDLTLHEQDPAKAQVTTLDVTLTESIAHAMDAIGTLAEHAPVVAPMGPFLDAAHRDKTAVHDVIAASIAKYGKLLGDPARDMKLVQWLRAHLGGFP